jgi:hypothetical protein
MPDCVQTLTRIDGSLHEAIRAAEFDCKSWGLACRGRDFPACSSMPFFAAARLRR